MNNSKDEAREYARKIVVGLCRQPIHRSVFMDNSHAFPCKDCQPVADELTTLIQSKNEEIAAKNTALDFAKGAIMDAIGLEDGLDGAAGEGVMRIITEAQEKGTFDKEKADTFTGLERKLYDENIALTQKITRYEEALRKLEWHFNDWAYKAPEQFDQMFPIRAGATLREITIEALKPTTQGGGCE